jgi:Protein of unknown function (DUF664)
MTWTAPHVTRRPEPSTGDERTMLEAYLGFQRDTLLGKCAGLGAAALRSRSVEPSAMSLLGIVRHLAAVERWWFRINLAGEQLEHLFFDETNLEGDFQDVDTADPEADFATYTAELVLVDAAVARFSLEDTFYSKTRDGDRTLRWVYLHMIEEYARHNGHADLLRERIDGVTGQ